MRKYLYTTLLLALLAQEGVMAQENEGKKGGFFGKIKDTFSTEIKIGNYTFKDGSVYTGEMKGRREHSRWTNLRHSMKSFWITGKGRIGRPMENGSRLLKAIMEMSAR